MIREGEERDISFIKSLLYFLSEEMNELEPYYADIADGSDDYIRLFMDDKNKYLFVVEEDGLVVGMMTCSVEYTPLLEVFKPRKYLDIYDIIIHPGFRDRGYGKLMMEKAEEIAEQREVNYINLSVLSKNKRAIKFYESMGYRPYSLQYRKILH